MQFGMSGAPETEFMKQELGIFILLIVLCIIVSAINPNFLLAINLQNLARQIGAFGIFSIGLGLVIITGGIELSVGSMMALLGVLLSMMLTEQKFGVVIALLACVGVAMFLSLIHGLLITRVNMQPFIVTLCRLRNYFRLLHQLSLAGKSWECLRALWHRRRSAGGMFFAWGRRFSRWHYYRRGAASSPAQSG